MSIASRMRQLFDPASSTYTYLLLGGDVSECDAALIDPVAGQAERDLAAVRDCGAVLRYVLETHVHADHVTSAGLLRERTGCRVGTPEGCGVAASDIQLTDGLWLPLGDAQGIRVIHTPGHTPGSSCYLWNGHLFTGDTLLIGGCGRTDFQGGSAGLLYDSVMHKLFTLPQATRVWPGHDYRGKTNSSIADERAGNPRFAVRDRPAFIALMNALDLTPPELLDVAPEANRRLGLTAQQREGANPDRTIHPQGTQ